MPFRLANRLSRVLVSDLKPGQLAVKVLMCAANLPEAVPTGLRKFHLPIPLKGTPYPTSVTDPGKTHSANSHAL